MGRVFGFSEPVINRCQVLKSTPKGHKAKQNPEILYMSRWGFYELVAKYEELKKKWELLACGCFFPKASARTTIQEKGRGYFEVTMPWIFCFLVMKSSVMNKQV